jgi:RsiW-degrading membrane proteinase PrsW (M82 family)
MDVLSEGAVNDFVGLVLGLLPVTAFLVLLVFMDSYKLLPLRDVVVTVVVGSLVALLCLYINPFLMTRLTFSDVEFRRYAAPIVEELLKAVYIVYLLRANRVGFLVDAAILGFAVGTGFALFENVHYHLHLDNPRWLIWVVRGFGTAIVHGSTMAVFAILTKGLTDRHRSTSFRWFLPGILAAIIMHSLFNHFFVPGIASTAIVLTTMPLLVIVTFEYSEKATRRWLGTGMDADLELIELIRTGQIREDNIGVYLQSLRSRFPGEVVADMLCLLQIQLELSIQAKALLMARQAGLELPAEEGARENLQELGFLQKAIGRTGRLAIAPFIKTSSRDLWQIYMLSRGA